MKKTISALSVLLLCSIWFLYLRGTNNTNSINWYNGSISDAFIMNDEKLIMINFHKNWWSACKLLDANTFSNTEISQLINENIVSIKIDYGTSQGKKLFTQYNLSALPSTVFLDKDSNVLEIIPGYLPPYEFKIKLKRLCSIWKKLNFYYWLLFQYFILNLLLKSTYYGTQ